MTWRADDAAFACPGVHAAPERDDAQRVTWHPPSSRYDRVRVVKHTCEFCRVESWELCAAGGLMFIRRVDRSRSQVEVAETEHLPGARIRPLWVSIIAGTAR